MPIRPMQERDWAPGLFVLLGDRGGGRQSLGFQILATVPGAFEHRQHGYVGLHVMFKPLTPENAG